MVVPINDAYLSLKIVKYKKMLTLSIQHNRFIQTNALWEGFETLPFQFPVGGLRGNLKEC